MSNHLSRKRPADIFLEFLTHSSSILVVFLNELSTAITQSPNMGTQEAIEIYLESRPDSNLAYVINVDHQLKKLDLVAEDMLESFLEHKSYNCEPVRVFLRQILSKVILDVTIQSCSRAEFINDWIVYLLEDPPAKSIIAGEVDESISKPSGGTEESNTSTPEPSVREESPEEKRHKRVVSKAQEAMDEAMQEAARLTQLIAEEDARRARERDAAENQSTPTTQDSFKPENPSELSSSVTFTDDASESTNQGIYTPTSSHSDQHQNGESPPTLPLRPEPTSNPTEPEASVERPIPAPFTSFDQIMPQDKPTALLDDQERLKKAPPPLTLHNANIVIMEDSDPSDRLSMRSKPTTEYLIQVEPSISYYPGWMIVRKLTDFEALHQVLFRIARVTDAKKFAESHPTLPNWKGMTKSKYSEALDRYLVDAVQHKSLADSEGMKRFLEKDIALSKTQSKQSAFPGLGAIENVGKGMIDVLAQAPKGVAGGGKAIIGGVTGVLNQGRNPKKPSISSSPAISRSSTSLSTSARVDGSLGAISPARQSQDSLQSSPTTVVDTQPPPVPQMERRPSSIIEADTKPKQAPSWASEPTPILGGDQILSLPPPPSAIPDDYEIHHPESTRQSIDNVPRISSSTASSSAHDLLKTTIPEEETSSTPQSTPSASTRKSKQTPPASDAKSAASSSTTTRAILTERETQIAVELSLACITELYKLSSAWSVRLAFLNAAKSILLRPGNAQLESIRALLQDTVLDGYSSDAGIAALIQSTRANTLPTDEERAAWPAERTAEEREELRRKARRLLTEKGMPQALNSVMGSAASGEALGRVFDAVQVQKVARGLVFGVMLQALRAVTQ
jgi:sorting nexin-like protein/PXA domain-containing protein